MQVLGTAKSGDDLPEVSVHSLPYKIQYDGPANVRQFFIPEDDTDDPSVKRATFRGRELCGTAHGLLPDTHRKDKEEDLRYLSANNNNFYGLVLSSSSQQKDNIINSDYNSTEIWEASGRFSGITNWYHGRKEHELDEWPQGMNLIHLIENSLMSSVRTDSEELDDEYDKEVREVFGLST